MSLKVLSVWKSCNLWGDILETFGIWWSYGDPFGPWKPVGAPVGAPGFILSSEPGSFTFAMVLTFDLY